MQALIEDLLAFARVGGTLRREDVDLASEVPLLLADLAGALTGADVTVGELPTVCGDATQLRAVLQNLVANAAKFTRPGQTAEIAIAGRRSGEGWRIEVADRGRGIDAADAERVFEPLVRLTRARTAPASVSRPAAGSCRPTAAGSGSSRARAAAPWRGSGCPTPERQRAVRPGRSSIRCSATRAHSCVSASTEMTFGTCPATSDSSAHTRWGRSMRFIVEQ